MRAVDGGLMERELMDPKNVSGPIINSNTTQPRRRWPISSSTLQRLLALAKTLPYAYLLGRGRAPQALVEHPPGILAR